MHLCLGYIRVSTDKQETLRQANAIKEYCAQHGFDLLEILEEPVKSGRSKAVRRGPEAALRYYNHLINEDYDKIEREMYAELLRRVAQEKVDAVIFYALDRLSRDCIELLLLDIILKKYGVKLITISQGGEISTDSAAGKFMYRMFATQCELECDMISERTVSGLKALKEKRGENWNIGQPRVGWKKINGKMQHDPLKWPVVERIWVLRHIQGFTYKKIEAVTGVDFRAVKTYLDAYTYKPKLTPEQLAELEKGEGNDEDIVS